MMTFRRANRPRGCWARRVGLWLPTALVAVTLLLGNTSSWAGRPTPPPPPVEAGTVYFRFGNSDIYSMRADGTNLALALSGATIAQEIADPSEMVPTSRTYGGSRWWLWMGPREDGAMVTEPGWEHLSVIEFFVGVPGVWKVRVTNLWEDYRIRPSTGPQLTWSNDQRDSFFSFVGCERQFVPDPNDTNGNGKLVDLVNGPINVYKIPFRVEVQVATGVPRPVRATEPAVDLDGEPVLDVDGEPILVTAIDGVIPQPGWNQQGFSWSPDGSTVLYQWFEEGTSSTGSQQFRVMLWTHGVGGPEVPQAIGHGVAVWAPPAHPAPVEVWRDDRWTGALTGPQKLSARYSPDGQWIAFGRFNSLSSVGRDILKLSADAVGKVGLQDTVTMLTAKNMGYSQPLWSPANGSQCVAREVDGRKGIDVSKWPRNLVRFPNPDGTVTRLTGSFDPTVDKTPITWTLDTPWIP